MRKARQDDSVQGKARAKLLEHMEELLAAGERKLPGVRELAAELGVGFMTANRLLRVLAMEGRIRSVPRKGNYINELPRRLNIGVALTNKEDFSFLCEPSLLRGALDVLDQNSCFVRIIQFSDARKARAIFSKLRLDGCLWNTPDLATFESEYRELVESFQLPSVLMLNTAAKKKPEGRFFSIAAGDFKEGGRIRARELLKRGHRKIAVFNEPPEPYCLIADEIERGMEEVLKANGGELRAEWKTRPGEAEERIPSVVEKSGVTAAIMYGGANFMLDALRAVNNLKDPSKIELLLDYPGTVLFDILDKLPRLKIIGAMHYNHEMAGKAAARSLVNFLRCGQPLKNESSNAKFMEIDELKRLVL